MSVNPNKTFYLKSIVREGRGRGRLKRGSKVAEVTINVSPSEDPEKPKQTPQQEEVECDHIETNQFLPGAIALSSFILIFFLLYLERKDHINFSSELFVSYPYFVGCEDNKHCVLESKELQLQNTNVTHFFIFILMFVGYLPAHILYLTTKNKRAYERIKNMFVIVLFSVLFAIVQGQHNILYLITIALNNFLIFGIGILIEYQSNYNYKKFKWGYFFILFINVFIQTIPTITAHYNRQDVPGFLFVLSFLWASFFVIEVLFHYKPHLGYLHLIVQILTSITYSIFFWEYAKID